jgi:hypothetical protein
VESSESGGQHRLVGLHPCTHILLLFVSNIGSNVSLLYPIIDQRVRESRAQMAVTVALIPSIPEPRSMRSLYRYLRSRTAHLSEVACRSLSSSPWVVRGKQRGGTDRSELLLLSFSPPSSCTHAGPGVWMAYPCDCHFDAIRRESHGSPAQCYTIRPSTVACDASHRMNFGL